MEKLIIIALLLFGCTDNSTKSTTNSTAPVNTSSSAHLQVVDNIADAIMHIEIYQGNIEDFRLGLGETVLYSGNKLKRDLAIEIIGEKVSSTKKWRFADYEDKDNLRIYNFKKVAGE